MADLIDRKAAIDALHSWERVYNWDETCREDREKVYAPSDAIEDLPSAEPEREMGRWMFSPDHAEGICTNCNYKIYGRPYNNTYLIVPYNFCPNCGAPMEGGEEE